MGLSFRRFCKVLLNFNANQKGSLLDAKVEGENRRDVFIKRVHSATHPYEAKIASRLGSLASRKDKTNHCVPILAVFYDDWDSKYQYIVMPVLRPFDDPNFTTFGEVIDFVNQTLEARFFTLAHSCILKCVSGSLVHAQSKCGPSVSSCCAHGLLPTVRCAVIAQLKIF